MGSLEIHSLGCEIGLLLLELSTSNVVWPGHNS